MRRLPAKRLTRHLLFYREPSADIGTYAGVSPADRTHVPARSASQGSQTVTGNRRARRRPATGQPAKITLNYMALGPGPRERAARRQATRPAGGTRRSTPA